MKLFRAARSLRGSGSPLLGVVVVLAVASCASVDTGTPADTAAARAGIAARDLQGRWTRGQAATVVEPEWWRRFGDPTLDDLIARSIRDGIDMKLLAYRIDKARQDLVSVRKEGVPVFSAGAAGEASRARVEGGASASARTWDASLEVTWEADIWGKLRQRSEAAKAELLATEAEWRAGYLVLVRDVAASYFRLRLFDEQQGIHRAALEQAERILGLYRRQLEARLISRDAVAAQEAEILRLRREIEEMKRQRVIEVNALAVLLGEMAGNFDLPEATLRGRVPLVEIDTDAVKTNLLERRPDVVAADHRLTEAYRLREASKAARLPSVTIGGTVGLSAGLASPLTFLAQFVPQITFPALDPRTKVKLKISEIELAEARDQYIQVVLEAVQEAENSLENLRSHRRQIDLEKERRELLVAAREGVRKRLKAGFATQVEVFEAERTLLAAEQLELELYAQNLLDAVLLFNALGGGW